MFLEFKNCLIPTIHLLAFLNIRDAHPDYVPPKSKYAKAVAPRPPTPFNLFSDEKMEELLAEGVILSDARFVLGQYSSFSAF
jgi:hypothetical protein